MNTTSRWLVLLALLAPGCAKTPVESPPAIPVAPAPPKLDWLAALATQTHMEVPVAGSSVPLAPIGVAAPLDTPTVVIGPDAITLDGGVVVRTAVVDNRIEAPAAEGRRLERHAIVGQLFDAAKAKNPDFAFNARGGAATPRKPVLMVADPRAPMGLLERARWSVWYAGWQPTHWVVRGPDGAPATLAAQDAPRCRPSPRLRITEVQGGSMTGSPSGLALSPATVVGPCSPQSQDQVFRSLSELLGVCWGRTVSQVSMLQGERDDATLTWVTAPDGSVEGVFAEAAFLGYGADLGDCILRSVKSKRHAAPTSGRCIATARLSYQAGEMTELLAVEPPVGTPAALATPLVHAECHLGPTALGFELAAATDGACGAGPSVWAQVQTTGLENLPHWLDEVTGVGGTRLASANVHVDEKATLATTLATLDALGRTGTQPELRLSLD